MRPEDRARVNLIDPTLHSRGWTEDLIRRERTPGGSDIIDGKPRRREGRTDYLLCLSVIPGKPPLPVALVEAKAEDVFPTLAIQQAKRDAALHRVPFVFATNGHLYAEYREDTGQIRDNLPLASIPMPDELRSSYEALRGIRLDSDAARAILMPYKGGEAARWYFQDAAIRAALEKIARGGSGSNRVLLSLATASGKTIIAAQMLHKIAQAGQLKRALFVCDRDELRTQAMGKLHAIFGDNAQIVTTDDPQKNARILIASYQTLNITAEDSEPRFWRESYPKNYFSHIIIDECHRSAWGKWSIVLKDNPDAVHIGLTATPRIVIGGKKDDAARREDEAITAHNVEYFGEPVYEYTIGQGQEDGYLAACEVVRRIVDLDKKEITRQDIEKRTATDPFTGQKVQPEHLDPVYTREDYETKLMLPDRVQAMCEDLFQHLLDTGGPHQKTVIFCARDTHATNVSTRMNNIYNEWCRKNNRTPKEWYAFQCTGNPDLRPPAKDLIPDFRGAKNSHFIATTVELLSTGVDIPNLANVVFFRYIESPISFYQMVGRGTRTGEPRGSKQMFRVYDYTNATRLFGHEFTSRARPSTPGVAGQQAARAPGVADDVGPPRIIRVEGFSVQVQGDGRAVLCEEGGQDVLIPLEEYTQRLAARLSQEAPTLGDLRKKWIWPDPRRALLDALPGGEGAVRLVRALNEMNDCDLYDVLAELGYGVAAKSRAERAAAFTYKNRRWLMEFPERTASVLNAVARQFERGGIEELETPNLFDASEVAKGGGFDALVGLPQRPQDLIQATKERLLAP